MDKNLLTFLEEIEETGASDIDKTKNGLEQLYSHTNEFKNNIEFKRRVISIDCDLNIFEGNINKALSMSEELIELSTLAPELRFAMSAYNKHGLCCKFLGRVRESIESYLRAIELYKFEKNEFVYAKVLNNIADLLIFMGLYEQAENYINKGIAVSDKINNKIIKGSLLTNFGRIYSKLENYIKAEEYFKQSEKILVKEHNSNITSRNQYHYALIYDKLYTIDDSINMLYDLENEFSKLKEKSYLSNTYGVLIKRLRFTNRIKEAIDVINRFTINFKKDIDKFEIAETYLEIAKIYDELKRHEEALNYYKKYSDLKREHSLILEQELIENYSVKNEINQILIDTNKKTDKNKKLSKYNKKIQKMYQDMLAINDFTNRISNADSIDMILDIYNINIKKIFPSIRTGMFILNSDKTEFSVTMYDEDVVVNFDHTVSVDCKESLIAKIIREDITYMTGDIDEDRVSYLDANEDDFRDDEPQEVISYLATTLKIDNDMLGAICVLHNTKDMYNDYHASIFETIASNIAIALKNIAYIENANNEILKQVKLEAELDKANKELSEYSFIDPLTGIYNRRKILQILSDELFAAKRTKSYISILIIDVDKFKEYNDNYGHIKGDECLKSVSDVLTESVSDHCYSARYGGDEFIVVLPETNKIELNKIANTIYTAIKNLHIEHKYSSASDIVSLSIGGYTTIPNHTNIEKIIANADKALYNAKKAGRNRTYILSGDNIDE